jgi:hypothetical protein
MDCTSFLFLSAEDADYAEKADIFLNRNHKVYLDEDPGVKGL